MNPDLAQLLDDLYRRGREHDAGQEDRLARWRNLEPDSARLLAAMIRALRPQRLLELGTSNGYSTIWLADAARAVGGSLTTVEIDPDRAARAGESLAAAGVGELVQLVVADAADVLASSEDGAWDFILVDAERPAYASYWSDLARVLVPHGLLAVDNVISHEEELVGFRALVAADDRVFEAVAPTGAGVLLIVRVDD
jgi:predicted O-methyltransferase YrrM